MKNTRLLWEKYYDVITTALEGIPRGGDSRGDPNTSPHSWPLWSVFLFPFLFLFLSSLVLIFLQK